MEKLKVKRFYNYSEIDGSYIDYEDIQQDVWVLQIENKEYYANPAFSTDKEPLKPKEGFNVCFDEKNNKWKYIKNNNNVKNIENVDIKTENEIIRLNNKITFLRGILSSTDWYVARKLETGKEIPEQIKEDRETLRNEISDLRDELLKLTTNNKK